MEDPHAAIGLAKSALEDPALQDGTFQWKTQARVEAIRKVYRALEVVHDSLAEPLQKQLTRQLLNIDAMTAAQVKDVLTNIERQLPQEPTQMSRRLFVGTTLTAGAAIAGGIGAMQQEIPQQPAQQPAPAIPAAAQQPWRPQPGFYVLLATLRTPSEAQHFLQRWRAEPAGILQTPQASLVIVKQHATTLARAHDTYVPISTRIPCKIIRIAENGSITNQLTFEESLSNQSKRLIQETGNIYRPLILRALKRYPISDNLEKDIRLVEAVMWQESKGKPKEVSPAGARGLMQLMPRTFAAYHKGKEGETQFFDSPYHRREKKWKLVVVYPARFAHKCNIFDPEQNIDAGVHFLADLFRKYYTQPSDLIDILKRYNGGEGNFLTGENLGEQNKEYASKVIGTSAD